MPTLGTSIYPAYSAIFLVHVHVCNTHCVYVSTHGHCPQPRETHALQYWDEAMEDRKHQQDYLTSQ